MTLGTRCSWLQPAQQARGCLKGQQLNELSQHDKLCQVMTEYCTMHHSLLLPVDQ